MNESVTAVKEAQDDRRRFMIARVKLLIDEGAMAWRLSRKLVVFILIMPLLVAALGILSGLLGKETYKWFTAEDGFAENLQVIFYSAALILSLLVASRHHRTGEWTLAVLYYGLSLGFIFLIGEEISWGQRLFGWRTSAAIAAINKQNETNLHNIYGVRHFFKWFKTVIGAYGTLAPVMLLFWRPSQRWDKLVEAIIPHLTLVPYFLPVFIWQLFRNTTDVPSEYSFVIAEYTEVIELILAIGFLLFVASRLRWLQESKDAQKNRTSSQ